MTTVESATAELLPPSLQKQRWFSQFAAGSLTLDELTQSFESIKPTPNQLSRRGRFALIAATIIAALLVPPAVRQGHGNNNQS